MNDLEAVRATLQRYAARLDEFDFAGAASVFAVDVAAQYASYDVMNGRSTVEAFLRSRTEGVSWQQHNVTVVEVAIDGDTARSVAYFIAHLNRADGTTKYVGEYRDTLRRTADGWEITERRQITGFKG